MNSKKWFIGICVILFIAVFLLSLFPIRIAHWWDETVYLQHAETISSGRTNYDEWSFRPPLLPIMIAGGYLFNHHVMVPNILIALLFSIGVIFVALTGRELFGYKTGIISSVIFGLSPFLLKNAHDIMTDLPAVSILAIALYFFVKSINTKENHYWFITGLFFGLAILMKFTTLVVLVLIPLYYVIVERISVKSLWYACFGTVLILLPYFIWAQVKFGFFLHPFISAVQQVTEHNEGIVFYLKTIITSHEYALLIGLLIFILMWLLFIKKRSFETTLIAWTIVFILYLSITAHKEARYLIPAFLPLSILAGRGWTMITNKVVSRILLILFVLIVLFALVPEITAIKENRIIPYKSEAMRVSEKIVAAYPPNTIIYANNNYPVFAYYTNMKTIRLREQNELFYEVFPSNMRESGLIIVFKGIKHPTAEWLDSHQEFKKVIDSESILVYEYAAQS